MKRFVTGLVALSMMLAMFAPAPAFAESSTCQAYNPQTCNTITPAETTHSAATGETSTGTLPFTGLDAGLLGLAGSVLIVGGAIVRAGTRRTN